MGGRGRRYLWEKRGVTVRTFTWTHLCGAVRRETCQHKFVILEGYRHYQRGFFRRYKAPHGAAKGAPTSEGLGPKEGQDTPRFRSLSGGESEFEHDTLIRKAQAVADARDQQEVEGKTSPKVSAKLFSRGSVVVEDRALLLNEAVVQPDEDKSDSETDIEVFSANVLSGLNLKIPARGGFLLYGPPGSGTEELLNVLSGATDGGPTRGLAQILGGRWGEERRFRPWYHLEEGISVVPRRDEHLLLHVSARSHVRFLARASGTYFPSSTDRTGENEVEEGRAGSVASTSSGTSGAGEQASTERTTTPPIYGEPRVEFFMELVGLGPSSWDEQVQELSLSDRRRLAVALALVYIVFTE